MKIAFYADSCIPIHSRSLEERPLGGTETGLIHVARLLAARGHEVYVFNQFNHPVPAVTPDGHKREGGLLQYCHSSKLREFEPFDALIAVKDWRPAFFGALAAKYFYWTGDGPEQYATYGLGDARVEQRFTSVFIASEWQGQMLSLSSGISKDRLNIVGNGIAPEFFTGVEHRLRHRLIYTSAPYRGLNHLVRLFPKIREIVPNATLEIFGGMALYDSATPFQGPHVELQRQVFAALSAIPGVTVHGAVTQPALAREYMRSAVYVYPNTVPETFCITAIEAQAGGCPVVGTAMAGLNESVGEGGILIPGLPGNSDYDERFVEGCLILLRDDTVWNRFSGIAQARVSSRFTWDSVTSRLEDRVTAALRSV